MTPTGRRTPNWPRRWAIAALAAAAGGLGAVFAKQRTPAPVEPDEAVKAFLTLSLPDASGTPIKFARFAGKPLVVNFWATWCPPCVEEMPELSALFRERSPKGLQMLGIGIDSAAKVAEFSTKTPVSYPLVVAGLSGTELARSFGNTSGGLPFTVLIDRQGRIVQRIPGRVRIDALRTAIDAMIA
jgi:peroxiredoxin